MKLLHDLFAMLYALVLFPVLLLREADHALFGYPNGILTRG